MTMALTALLPLCHLFTVSVEFGEAFLCKPNIGLMIDLSDLPTNTPTLLTAPPASAPGFIAVSLGFSTVFVFIFTLISLRSKLGPKLGPALDKPFLNRAVAWLGLLGFLIGMQ